ncbi:MAG: hypothetical protein RLZZ337_1599 [Bacteroidota bacterium]
MHSPFIYGFCTDVLDKKGSPNLKAVEQLRSNYIKRSETIEFTDFGKNGAIRKAKIAEIAKRSLKPKKYARLLSRSVRYFNSNSILELGTSLGITTAYLAHNEGVNITSLEGDPNVASLARNGWSQLGIKNISQIIGNFGDTLNAVLNEKTFDFIYFDGNHSLKPTLAYFERCLEHSNTSRVFVFDDIHYSEEMEEAWSIIKNHSKVVASIDLFFVGYIFFDTKLTPAHYILRF